MQISGAIEAEAAFFLSSMIVGVLLILLYDVFRISRRVIKHGVIWIGVEDFFYWVICVIAVFLLLYKENEGRIRGFSFLGMLLGMGIYYLLFSRFIMKLGVWCLKPVVKIGKKILHFCFHVLKKIGKTIKIGLCKL